MASTFVRFIGWTLALSVFISGLVFSFRTHGSSSHSLPSKVENLGVLGSGDRAVSDFLVGVDAAFHRLLDSELQKGAWEGLVDEAEKLPASRYRDVAIKGVLAELQKSVEFEVRDEKVSTFSDTPLPSLMEQSPQAEQTVVLEDMLHAWYELSELLEEQDSRSPYLSRLALNRFRAESVGMISGDWEDIPSVELLREKARVDALAGYEDARSNDTIGSKLLSIAKAWLPDFLHFLGVTLVAGFLGTVGESLAHYLRTNKPTPKRDVRISRPTRYRMIYNSAARIRRRKKGLRR